MSNLLFLAAAICFGYVAITGRSLVAAGLLFLTLALYL